MTTLNVKGVETHQDALYEEVSAEYGAAVERLARAYEFDAEKRRDLIQEIHFQLWRSFRNYDSRCSLRTWIYRVAHHVAVSYVMREQRRFTGLVSLEELEKLPVPTQDSAADRQIELDRLSALIQKLQPLDRQVIVCYLEGMDAASTAEITGLSPGSVAMRIHRIKNVLAKRFREGGNYVG